MALSPATDAVRAGLIRSSVFGGSLTATFSGVPAGTYHVYLYVWEDNNAETYNVTVQDQVVLRNYNSGAAGHWDRLGPYAATVSAGSLSIGTAGGYANLSGIELWKQTTAARALAQPGSPLAAVRPGLSSAMANAQAYPNPAPDGRFQVLLPEELQGEISYTLLSALGARLATGHLTTDSPAPARTFDFSREMISPGLYHLRLQNPTKQATIRLIRP